MKQKNSRISVNNTAGIFFFIAAVAATYCGITLASDVVEAIIFYGTAAFSVFFTIIYGEDYNADKPDLEHCQYFWLSNDRMPEQFILTGQDSQTDFILGLADMGYPKY